METAEQFAVRRPQITAARATVDTELRGRAEQAHRCPRGQAAAGRAGRGGERGAAQPARAEEQHPPRQLDLRARLARELGLDAGALPFAGELIAVRQEEADWEGAAERLLHSFALSILVPDEHYRAVSGWIDEQHLRERVVYYRVPAPALAARGGPPELGRGTLAAKLEVKDTDFAPWLERELAHRADVECVQTMAEFRRASRALTRAGQIKGGVRHEKDDRFRIDDRSRYVLGWSNERKIDALLSRAAELARQLTAAGREEAGYRAAAQAAVARGQVLAGLTQTSDFTEIDYQSAVNRIAELTSEHATLTAASAELARLDADLAEVQRQIAVADSSRSEAVGKLGRADQSVADATAELAHARAALAEPSGVAATAQFDAIGVLLAQAGQPLPDKPAACDRAENSASTELMSLEAKVGDRRVRLSNRIASAMTLLGRRRRAATHRAR